MIPKIIHYCWFGNGKKPKFIKKCIKSWRKKMPDYEIKEWNENNFDVNCNEYVKTAYQEGKWAFVSDYVRLKVLCDYGGLYFDTDVKILKSLDILVQKGPFLGREQQRDGGMINPGIGMAMNKGNLLLIELIKSYNESDFDKDKSTIVQRIERIIKEKEYKINEIDGLEYVNNICVYPAEYFCPMGYNGIVNKTKNTYCIHLYDGSWMEEDKRNELKHKRIKNKFDIKMKLYYAIKGKSIKK